MRAIGALSWARWHRGGGGGGGLGSQVALQQVQLDEFLLGVDWVCNAEDEDEDGSGDGGGGELTRGAEAAVAQCLFHLHHLANLWQPVSWV